MRVNVYAEEMTDRVEIISKEIDGQKFTGLRIYLELPVTRDYNGLVHQFKGPFVHRPGDDDSSAVTFWGKHDLRLVLRKALALLDEHYEGQEKDQGEYMDDEWQEKKKLREELIELPEQDTYGHTHLDPRNGQPWQVCVSCDLPMDEDDMHSAGECNLCHAINRDD